MKKQLMAIALLSMTATPAFARDMQYVLHIDGMTCPFCVATSEKALKKIDGVASVSTNLKGGTITVCADDDKVAFTDTQLAELFEEKGLTYRSMEMTGVCEA